MSRLSEIMAATHMTREQIRRAIATGEGRFNPDTYARVKAESDTRLVNLFIAMREVRRMMAAPITTAAQAGELRHLIQDNSPVDTGALRDSWNDPRTVQIMPNGKVRVDNPLPYARIQDQGGTIHRTTKDGTPYTIHIPAQHYVQKAVNQYNAAHAEAPVVQEEFLGGGTIAGMVGLIARGFAYLGQVQYGK